MSEPSPRRDVGPYHSAEQAQEQIAATMFGIPAEHAAPGAIGETVLMEALLLAGVDISPWEDVARQDLVRAVPPEVAQAVAGWILRAALAGQMRGVQWPSS